jgi:putative Mg2+ transporter-C (MgtC) family protein
VRAATSRAVTALGLVVGAGYYLIAAVFTAVIILTLSLFRRVEAVVPKKTGYVYVLSLADMEGAADTIAEIAAGLGMWIESVSLKRLNGAALMTFGFAARAKKEREFRRAVQGAAEILEINQP